MAEMAAGQRRKGEKESRKVSQGLSMWLKSDLISQISGHVSLHGLVWQRHVTVKGYKKHRQKDSIFKAADMTDIISK